MRLPWYQPLITLPRMAERILQMDKLAASSDEAIRKMEKAETVTTDFPIEIIV